MAVCYLSTRSATSLSRGASAGLPSPGTGILLPGQPDLRRRRLLLPGAGACRAHHPSGCHPRCIGDASPFLYQGTTGRCQQAVSRCRTFQSLAGCDSPKLASSSCRARFLLIPRSLLRGVFISEGDVHQRQRRLVQPAFARQRLAQYASAMTASATRLYQPFLIDAADTHQRLLLPARFSVYYTHTQPWVGGWYYENTVKSACDRTVLQGHDGI